MNNAYVDMLYHFEILAKRLHHGQTRSDGFPYISHPLRVAQSSFVEDDLVLTQDEIYHAKAAALLHDAVEATGVTYDELRAEGVPEPSLEAIRLVTRAEGVSYRDFITEIINSGNKIALAVKLADLTDNIRDSEKLDPDAKTKYGELRQKRWIPAYDRLIKLWLDLPEIS